MNLARLAATGSIVLLAAITPARAQPSPAATPGQLDRIEGKLDEVLRRLDALQGRSASRETSAEGAQEGPRAPGAPSSSPAALLGSSTGAPTASTRAEDKPGVLAVARPAPPLSSILTVPADTVGGFLYQGGPVRLDDVASRGVRYRGQAGIELQGWLRVAEAGRYQLGAEFGSPRGGMLGSLSCGVALWLEDRQVGQQAGELSTSSANPVPLTLMLGAELQPGLYKLRFWTTCGHMFSPVPVTAEVLIKAPSDLNLRLLTSADVSHHEE